MAELKTKVSDASVEEFLNTLTEEQKRQDAFTLLGLMKEVTNADPKLWGSNIVGFGDYHYKYASGREGDWFVTGFSPRKQNLTLYVMGGFASQSALLDRLGKHKLGKGCLYINKLKDIDLITLQELLRQAVAQASAANSADSIPLLSAEGAQ